MHRAYYSCSTTIEGENRSTDHLSELFVKHLDKIANVAVIVGMAVFLILVVRNEFGRPNLDNSPKKLLGTAIKLPELQFPLQRNSIVLALSTTCHFCQDSLPFYKMLATQ